MTAEGVMKPRIYRSLSSSLFSWTVNFSAVNLRGILAFNI